MSAAARHYESTVRPGLHDMRGHVETLYRLVRWLDARQVIELGVRSGNSTCALLAALDYTGGRLWSCDIAVPDVAPAISGDPLWTFAQGDSAELFRRAPRCCDLLFIDTSHELWPTRVELWRYGPKVKKRGVIALHDTELNGVAKPIREWLDAHPNHAYVEDPRSHGLGLILVR